MVSLEGKQRRHLAESFWSGSSIPLNNVFTALPSYGSPSLVRHTFPPFLKLFASREYVQYATSPLISPLSAPYQPLVVYQFRLPPPSANRVPEGPQGLFGRFWVSPP